MHPFTQSLTVRKRSWKKLKMLFNWTYGSVQTGNKDLGLRSDHLGTSAKFRKAKRQSSNDKAQGRGRTGLEPSLRSKWTVQLTKVMA